MASTSFVKDERNRKLYEALIHEDKKRVLELCQHFEDGPLHVVTIHDDTVLHVATFSKQVDLVLELLERVSNSQLEKLTRKNEVGNTILHEACTSDKLVLAAKEMLIKAPDLLYIRNAYGVTPLYRSVLYGKTDMFKFLVGEIDKRKNETEGETDRGGYYEKMNKTTVLHTAVTTESFDLALLIAQRNKHLVTEKDKDGMTALQLLACKSSTFESRGGGCSMHRMYSCVSTEDGSTDREGVSTECLPCKEGCWEVPLWEEKRRQNERYKSALTLAKFLIKEDTSWIATEAVEDRDQTKYHKFGEVDPSSSSSSPEQRKGNTQKPVPSTVNIAATPLFLATKFGCVDIVKEILSEYPQAVEHIDHEGRTILHLAIKYREMQILEIVEQMGVPMRRLVRKVDQHDNTILHMVGEKTEDRIVPMLRAPAFELQENFLLFERVSVICPRSLLNTLNRQGMTAQQLFEEMNKPLRKEATEWIKRTAENCSIVAVLIATVAFASAYTIPGGSDQSTGFPILVNRPFFVVFTTTDVLSITLALTAVIIFLRILTFAFRLEEMLMLGVTLLIVSVTMMMIAFAATVILMTHNRGNWTKVALFTASFVPVSIFTVSYLPPYLSLMKTHSYSLKKKVALIFPRFNISKYYLKHYLKQIGTSISTSCPKLRASSNNPV